MTASKPTTGELRRLAYEREEHRDWAAASSLWTQAADAYPARLLEKESGRDDLAKLQERALVALALSQPATTKPGEIAPAPATQGALF